MPLNPALVDPFAPEADPVMVAHLKPKENGSGLSLSKAKEKYLTAMAKGQAWTPKTAYQIGSNLEMAAEFLGDPALATIERTQIAAFKELLFGLPATHGKSAASKEMTLEQAVADAKARNLPTLTSKTVKRHISALIGFFEWARAEGHYTAENPASRFKFPKTRRARDEGPAWSPVFA